MLTQLFDKIGLAITSLGAVIFVMLMTITGMIFFSHTLFLHVFPSNMEKWEKILATWLMALGWELTVLITTCNTKHINKRIPALMAVASGVIVLFFIQAFDSSLSALQIVQRWFVGILAATINYIYADLFYAKWNERNAGNELPLRLKVAQSELVELRSQMNELESSLTERGSRVRELESELKEHQSFRAKIQRELTCPHCKEIQPAFGTLHAHKGHCSKNPKNLSQ